MQILPCILAAPDDSNGLQPFKSQDIGGSGNGKPIAKYELNVTVEPDRPYRNTNVTLNITFRNNEPLNALDIQQLKFDIFPKFDILSDYTRDKSDQIYRDKIEIPEFKVLKQKSRTFLYIIHIPISIEAKKTKIIDPSTVDIQIRNHWINSSNHHLYDQLDIQNNYPKVISAKVDLSKQFLPLDDETLFFYGNSSDPFEALFNISAWDIEDGNDLQFAGFIRKQNGSEYGNRSSENEFSHCGTFRQIMKNNELGERYSLWVKVKDNDNSTNISEANINLNGKSYKNIFFPDMSFYEGFVILLIFLFAIIVTYFIYRRRNSCGNPVITTQIAVILIFIPWILYLCTLNLGPRRINFINQYIFFNTLPIFELIVFITIFLIISKFIATCFSLDDEGNLQWKALFENCVFTMLILLIFIFVFPKIPSLSSNLPNYYLAMATILGTIFALIVTLSGQFPKNVFMRPFCSTKSETGSFSYPNQILQSFVALYGSTLGISILGLVAGTQVRFNTFIMDPFHENPIFNLLPLAIFEITFLLIPPTIISLYYLLQVISLRGKITITSKPSHAKVFLNKINHHENRKDEPDRKPVDLNLSTPCTLMLRDGEYRITLINGDYKIDTKMTVGVGEEKEFFFALLNPKLPNLLGTSNRLYRCNCFYFKK
jgi:hypothetical protein